VYNSLFLDERKSKMLTTRKQIIPRDLITLFGLRSKSWIEKTVSIAEKGFIPGNEIQKNIRGKIAKLVKDRKAKDGPVDVYYDKKKFSLVPSIGSKKVPNVYRSNGKIGSYSCPHPRIEDSNFTIDANSIKGTNFIAAAGPQEKFTLGDFFENTVFHREIPIYRVIALGDTLGKGQGSKQDFYNYIIREEKESLDKFNYSIQKESLKGEYTAAQSGQVFPRTIIESTISVTPKGKEDTRELKVTLINLEDGEAINLTEDKDNVLKDILWQCLLEKGNKLVHCKAGLGRTGHLIFTLEILKNYKNIFSKDPETAAAKILEIVERIREDRFGLILIKEQFIVAIRNAHILYQYGLKKNLINNTKIQNKHPAEFKQRIEKDKDKGKHNENLQHIPSLGLHRKVEEKDKTDVTREHLPLTSRRPR
jgi:protein tyrosine phosphatase